MQTLEQLINTFEVDTDEHLDRDALVPVNSGLQRQGDVIVIPTSEVAVVGNKVVPVPGAGIPVVRGENGGNTHLLLAMGEVNYLPIEDTSTLNVGVFVVTEGAVAYLAHPEHGYMGIAPGTYTVRRQREQADEIRQVAD